LNLTGSKKNPDLTLEQKRKAVEPDHKKITIYRQCELLSLSRSSLYYKSKGQTEYNEQLMKLIDEQYIETPFYGIDKMTKWLRLKKHYVNHKRVRRLMRQMGLEAVYPRRKRHLSIPDKQHKIYPYLLRDIQIDRADQGSQFTSIDFTTVLLDAGIQISMDGKGRVFDNIFVERLWRTVKVEEVYLRDYQTVAEASYYLGRYFKFYNDQRLHQALGYRCPAELYGVAVGTPVALRVPSVPTALTKGDESTLKQPVFCLDNGQGYTVNAVYIFISGISDLSVNCLEFLIGLIGMIYRLFSLESAQELR